MVLTRNSNFYLFYVLVVTNTRIHGSVHFVLFFLLQKQEGYPNSVSSEYGPPTGGSAPSAPADSYGAPSPSFGAPSGSAGPY